jgi:serine/threonine-protein kinase
MTLPAGTKFGPYEIRDHLGVGGMGEVYLAHDTRLRRDVALKVLPPEVTGDAAARRRLLAEARLGARLDHPNICAIYEVGEHDGRDFIAMKRIPGVTLEDHLGGRPLSESATITLALQIADAVAHAHTHGIIHRDLKRQNVMITDDGRAVVLDFGIARFLNTTADPSTTLGTRTATGVLAGTPAAMSPEQARGEPIDARSDVFSFGTLLYQMLTGRDPFAGASTAETLSAVLMHDPPPVGAFVPGTTPEIDRIVHKCLEKDPELRYGSMREVTTDLERLRRASTPATARSATTAAPVPATAGPRKRRMRVGTFVIFAAVAAAVLGAVLWIPRLLHRDVGVHTLAVLPFRSLSTDPQENFLGLGIADAVISRTSQVPGLVVRPTSAVRRYVTVDVDAARAAVDLKTDAVLEGTWQRDGERLRVTANLLRASDGASLWSDRFDATSQDIFDIQDQISDRLAARLSTRLAGPVVESREHGGTRNPEAYEAYSKGLYFFSERGFIPEQRRNSDVAIQLFQEAVRLDPNYALAHAQLAHAYVWNALFIELKPTFIERARAELGIAERIDPKLGLVPYVRSQILYSRYEGWRLDDAIREMKRAQQLGAREVESGIGDLCMHLGLEEGWRRYTEQELARDPMNQRIRQTYVQNAYLLSLPELGRKLQKELLNEEPDERYWALVGNAERSASLDSMGRSLPDNGWAQVDVAFLRTMQGRFGEADSVIRYNAPRLTHDRSYHHVTFEIAQIYGKAGNAREALRWLEETVRWGFPCYPLFERDSWLDPIRKDPAFAAFMAKLRADWERYRRELEE